MTTENPSIKISRILHAGYIFESNNEQIAFDPIFENPFSHNCYAYPSVKFDNDKIKKLNLSAVFISHYHDDHCSLESLNLLNRNTPIYIYCIFEELFLMIRDLGFVHVHSLKIDVPVIVGSFEVIPRRALDEDVDSLFQIKAAGFNILNVVDSWIDEETLSVLIKNKPWDMILWPFQTMREIEVISPLRAMPAPKTLPIEWLQQLQALSPSYVVPSSCQFLQESWSWYNNAFFPITYSQFKKEVESSSENLRVLRLDPSDSVVLTNTSARPAPPLSFIECLEKQKVDYIYSPQLTPPTTAVIATHFAPLKSNQLEKVKHYCLHGLLNKYKTLEHSEQGYFLKPRLWRLSLYDHTGARTDFTYRLQNDSIELVTNDITTINWLTEVPIAKLYAALESGETLTSMYIRINDQFFSPEIEKELLDADISADPLIRCLFDGVFGAYQKMQLERITARNAINHNNS